MTPLLLALALAAQQPPARFAAVTYVSGAQIYVGAGRSEGVREGMELTVLRGDTAVATLQVQFVSSSQAACVVVRGAANIEPGDRVRFVAGPDTTSVPSPAAPASPPAPARRRGPGSPGVHGRLAGRYGVSQVAGAGSLAQPAFDARVTAAGLAGTPLGLIADVRARSSRSSFAGAPTRREQATDVYQLALLWHQPGAPFRVAVGRQYVGAVSSVVLLDGALAEVTRRRVSFGVFGGTEPAVVDSLAPGPVRDLGAYMQLHAPAWALTLGAAGSYTAGRPNREFGFAQLRVTTPRLSLLASQQLDYYRAAKVAAGERSLSFTSAYVSASLRANRSLSVDAGVDNRRNVRLYRDLADPLTAFDDHYRRAVWGGASYAGRHARLRLEARGSGGGAAGPATAVTVSGGLDRLWRGLSLGARATRYRAGASEGWLGALHAGADLTVALHVDASGGRRRDVNAPATLGARSTTWLGAEATVSIARAWYALISLYRESSPEGALHQAYTSISWRF